jgi:hypothetical protein
VRVRFLRPSASPAGTFQLGQVAEIDGPEASRLVHSGVAEALVSAPETAAIEPDPPDKGTPRRRRPQKRG